ncbi:hypothetical protein Tco_1075098, partial [Tanacetum coccineum]
IERLQQGKSLNVQDVKTNLFWEFGKFTSRDGESMESYYSRFYKLMNELTRNNLQVTTMQVNVQFLQQFQHEVTDIRAERIAKSANPLALLAAAQPYSDNCVKEQIQHHLPQDQVDLPDTKAKRSSNQLHLNLSQYLKKTVILNNLRGIKDMQKNLALLAKYFKRLYKPTNNNLRTTLNSRNKTEDTTPRYNNDNQSGQFGNQRTMTVAGTREPVGSPVVQQTGIQCFNCKGFGQAKAC